MDRYDVYKESGISWIGAIPANWNVVGLSQLGAQRKQKNVDGSTTNVLSLSYGKIKRRVLDNSGLLPESFNTYNVIQPGDVVLRLTDLQNDQNSLRVGQSDEAGIITSAYCTLKPKCYSRYLYYLLASFDYKKGFYGLAGGVRQSLTFETIRSLKFILPSEKEQEIICSYLDGFVINIDNLLRPLEQSITLLREYRQSIITEAVTHGLETNASMKPSGVEWIERVPESWQVNSIRGVTSLITNGYVGPTRDLFHNSGVRYIQSLHIVDGKLNFDKHPYYVSEKWSRSHARSLLKEGDVLVVQTGAIGNCAYVTKEYEGCNCHALIILRPDEEEISGKYLYYYLTSHVGREKMLITRTGTTHPHLNSTKVQFVQVVIPPICEQYEIVEYLDAKTAEIDTLIASKERQVELLREYRKSIISEAVTGKFKVPGLE